MKRSNVILIGMSGVGKSTMGAILAKRLGLRFLDTDTALRAAMDGASLQSFLDANGPEAFLALEEQVVSALELHGYVVATGGSVVYSQKSMEHLKADGTTVFLSISYPALVKRLKRVDNRGVVLRNGATFADAFDERLPLYRQYADITVDCSGRPTMQIVQDIAALVK